MTDSTFIIRSMTREEINTALDWAHDEGWNPGIFDADPFHATDEEGFLIGMLGDEKVAMIAAIRYDEKFGHIGFHVVKPEHRHKDYGEKIFQAAMDRLAGCQIGTDCLATSNEPLQRSGFHFAHRHIGFRCNGGGAMPPMSACEKIVSMPDLSLDHIVAYDRAFFPSERKRFWQKWISIPYSTVLGIRENGKLLAFGAMRPCREGFKIAPLFADTPEHAEALFMIMRAQTREEDNIFMDVPEANPEAMHLARRHDMEAVSETARMYTQAIPDLSLARTYGATSLELG